ncbi:MAG TPA: PAS domain S-box protein [Candidatus Limnocylindrales bacterium]|nr:PAS domain S-box protein [Candidatus Limnocylindrales bacterium]
MIIALLVFSSALQVVVALVALRAPRTARTRSAWWVFAAALMLMALRRLVALGGILAGSAVAPTRPTEELIAVGISTLLLTGVLRMRVLWAEADAALHEAKESELARRESEEIWKRVFEFAPDGYVMLESDGRLARMNLAAAEIVGLSRESAEGRYIFELGFLDDEGLAQAARNLSMMQRGEDPGPAEYTFHRPDGTQRQVEVISYTIDVRDRPLLLTIVHDVTRRRRIEAELKRSHRRLEEAQRVAGVVTFEIDLREATISTSGDPRLTSPSTDGRLHMSLEEGFNYIVPEDRERVLEEMAAGTGGKGRIVVEYRQFDARLGREATVRTTAHAQKDEHGHVTGLVGATVDVTEIRHAEQEIRTLNTALEERVRARTAELERAVDELEAFSYSVSHDLRSPLRAMAGYSELVLEEEGSSLSAASVEHLERIRASSVRMGGLIDGLLSLARLSRATRNDVRINLSEIARTILAEMQEADPGRDVEIIVADDLETVGDAGMMSVMLQNLLANAWKFTRSRAHARIEFGRTGGGDYFVRDNGVGFDAAQKSKLFRPFERLHRTDEFEGTGIGLATVARIVRHHGGHAWAEGSIGKGATFWFTLGAPGLRDEARLHTMAAELIEAGRVAKLS